MPTDNFWFITRRKGEKLKVNKREHLTEEMNF